jgi:hypothetical protein
MQNPNHPETTRLSIELAKTYQSLLRPFEEVWAKSLLKQQQTAMEAKRIAATRTYNDMINGTVPPLPSTSTPAIAPAPYPATTLPTTAAMANMSTTQLAAYGFSEAQVDFLRQAQQGGAGAGAVPGMEAKLAVPQRAPGTSSLRAHTSDPTMEQLSEARSIVAQFKAQVESGRRESDCLHLVEMIY